MFFYARADTHFLLYIYDNMRNELIDKTNAEVPEENKLELVLQKSKETSLFRFERQNYDVESGRGPGGWYQLLVKTPALFNSEQFAVFRAVHAWRDEIARIDDDSTAFVMPNHVIFSIAKLLPNDMVALLGIAHSTSHGVKSRAGELLERIKSARAQGKDGPTMMDVLRPNSVGMVAKAILPSVAKSAPNTLIAVVDDSQLRSEESTFWGDAFGSSIWDAPAAVKSDDGVRLAVPLPQLSSEIFETSNMASNAALANPSQAQIQYLEPVQLATPEPKKTDEAFVLKRGAKRKSDDISKPEQTTGEYDISLNEEELQAAQDKAERRAQRRAEKKLRKAQQKLAEAEGEAANSGEVDDEEPFDYNKAESVLHGKRNSGNQEGGSKRKKPFDPYAKSADAPKGMRRLQTERPGKSHTFKS
jgi:exosome complex exonuclease RRP6